MIELPNNQNYFQGFIDRAKNTATARGAKLPTWEDVWVAAADTRELADVLRQRGVHVDGFRNEIRYISKFLENPQAVSAAPSPEEVAKIAAELIDDLESFMLATSGTTEERQENLQAIINFIQRRLFHSMLEGKFDPREMSKRQAVLGMALQQGLSPLLTQAMAHREGHDLPVDIKRAGAGMLIQELIALRPEDMEAVENVIGTIEQMQDNPFTPPSPVEVVDQLGRWSEGFYTELMYRNGMRTNDVDREDSLAQILPAHSVQRVALTALDYAYGGNDKAVTARHIALALLRERDVQVHLRKLGIKDLMEFEDKVRKATTIEDKPEGGIRVHPQIYQNMRDLIEDLDEAYDAKPNMAELLRIVLTKDTEISKAFTKAGLTKAMRGDWVGQYEVDEEKKDEKDKDEFGVSDFELDRLIEKYCNDYTAQASKRKFDPMIGNTDTLDNVITKLMKRGKKNPIVIGDPGVGKTKILEGLAQAIVSGQVPKEMIGARLLMLDAHQMNDTPWLGMFESRILPIIKGISERNASGKFPPIFLGIDEMAHAMDAGAHSKGDGLRGLIKPYLTTGEMFLIGTATDTEFRTKLEKDPALARRLQPVVMKEPDTEETTAILKGIRSKYARHHALRIPTPLLAEIATLAGRYIHTVKQPDKSIDLLDEACAYARKSGSLSLKKEHIVAAVSAKTNVPAEFISSSERERYANIEDNLNNRVYDQPDAVKTVGSALQRAKAGFREEGRPIGNFLFVGPTGVGKTELSKALAEFLMGSVANGLQRFDMSEFMEKQAVARFIGAPPGYVGYEEGGGLINRLRTNPFGVYLYDEIEKAHPDVFNVLLRPFDEGVVTDGRGMTGDMRNVINVMTTNLGAEEVQQTGFGRGLDPVRDYQKWREMARPIYERAVKDFFKPEFLNRLDGVVYFDSLSPDTMTRLVEGRLSQTAQQLEAGHGLKLELAPEFLRVAADRGFDVRFGARPLKRTWASMVEDPMSKFLLGQPERRVKSASILRVGVANAAAIAPANQDENPAIAARRAKVDPVPSFLLAKNG